MNAKFNFKVLTSLVFGLLISLNVYAQDVAISGTVIDDFGDPVLGANVVVKGTAIGATTDLDGNFSFNAPKGSIVVISFIGYKSQEVVFDGTPLNITLSEDSEMLEDVIVIGYGAVKKNDLTGSVVAIKAEEVNRGAVTSPDQMLKGKVPGLLVTPPSGDPTEGATIRLRGAASLYASNDPLIVIDGVPVTSEGGAGMANPLATVNPNDIESYTVLKDASATAIYGSRASNGVIMITTKKGSGNKIQFSYSGSMSVKQNTETVDVLNSEQYLNLINTAYAGTERADAVNALAGKFDTDWQSKIYRTALTTDHNFSVFGQAGFLPYRISLGYTFDQATLKTGDNGRTNFSISLSPKFFKDHLSLNVNNKTINNKAVYTAGGAVGSALSFSTTMPERFDGNTIVSNGYYNWLQSDNSANTMAGINPLSALYDSHNENRSWRTLGNVQADYKLHGFEDLRFNVNLGYDFSRTEGETYNYLGTISAKRSDGVDQYNNYSNQNSNTLLEAYADYNKEFGKHNLDVMAGYSWQHNYVKYNSARYYNSQAIQDNFEKESQNPANLYQLSPTDRREYYIVSFYGRLNYNFAHKYYLTYTVRDDGSSRFSKDNRWGLFQSGALSWNAGEEDFIKEIDAISSLKVRLGYGQTGQQDIGMDRCYSYQAKYLNSSDIRMQIPWGNGYIYTLAPQAYNPNIKWETCTTYNVGVDFGFINGRINGSVDAYLRKTTDLLNDVPTPLGGNFSNTIISNVGDMENKGIEFNLNLIPIETKDLRWSLNFNGTFQDIEVSKLTNTPTADYIGVQTGSSMGSNEGFTSLYRVGYTPWTYYLYQQAYDENGKAIENVLVDRNGDGEITPDDRYVTGKSYQPKFFYGLSSQVSYKNWDFGFNAHGSVGGYILNKVAKGNVTSFSEDWQKGYLSNFTTKVLETGWTAAMSDYQAYSDMYLENGAFFRLDDINVGYTFDKIKNWKGSIRLGASVQNVFTITNYSGLDPELTASDGVDNNIIPRPRLFTFRLNVNF